MVALSPIRRLVDLEDWPALTPGQTITVDADGVLTAVDIGASSPSGPGMGWLTGAGPPSEDAGIDDQLYLDTDTGDVYKKGSGTWL
jgi:hypothetical protein